jgi:hypothetical protein
MSSNAENVSKHLAEVKLYQVTIDEELPHMSKIVPSNEEKDN